MRLAVRRAAQRKQVAWLDPIGRRRSRGERYRSMRGAEPGRPGHAVLRSERDAQLRAAVAALDEPYREVVALRFFAERSLAEIAEPPTGPWAR